MGIIKISSVILAIFILNTHAHALEIIPPPDISHTPLHEASEKCDLGKARSVLDSHPADLDKADRNNYTPLMLAAENGCQEAAALLIEKGAKIDAVHNWNNRTALLYAAEQNHAAIVGYLLAKGANPDTKTINGDTSLILALKGPFLPRGPKGNVRQTVANLLDHRAEVNVKGEFGRTPLMLAVNRGDAFLVSQLLQNGADPTSKDENNETAANKAEKLGLDYLVQLLDNPQRLDLIIQGTSTPLVDAVNGKKVSAVAAILKNGADVNLRFGNGSTALMSAAQTGQKEVVKILLDKGAEVNAKNGSNSTALMYAVAAGNLDVAKMLLQAGANPNVRVDNTSLLSMALKNSHSEMARLLIAKGASIDIKDGDEMTPLMLACIHNDLPLVKALLDKGVDVNSNDNKGSTALTYSISEKRNKIVPLLLAKGASVRTEELNAAINTRDLVLISRLIDKGADVKNSLLAALPNAGLEMVKLLVKKGADTNARNYNEKTALILAVESPSEVKPEVVRYLLNHNADVNAQDDKGMSALLVTAERGNLAIARMLLEKRANTAVKNNNGKSSWHIAAEKNDRKLMQLFEEYGASREYEYMNWEGRNASLKEPYKSIVGNNEEWEKLWQTAFSKPAPPIDFENFAVACIFLGEKTDWLYSIDFEQPYIKDGVKVIPYGLAITKHIMLRVDASYGQRAFGGQYHMKVFAKQKELEMQLQETKGKGDVPELFESPPVKMEQGSQRME